MATEWRVSTSRATTCYAGPKVAATLCGDREGVATVPREFRYRTLDSRSRHRRVVAKAEWLAGARGGNPRFVVTSLDRQTIAKQALYEELYCARGDMENRIKEQQLWLFADRSLRSPSCL